MHQSPSCSFQPQPPGNTSTNQLLPRLPASLRNIESIGNQNINLTPPGLTVVSTSNFQLQEGELGELIANVALANYSYMRSEGDLKDYAPNWTLQKELANSLATKELTFNAANGMLMDKSSGLVAYVFYNKNDKEIRVVFGGSSSGETAGEILTRSWGNAVSTSQQWINNITNAIDNKMPRSYCQAAILTGRLINILNTDPRYEGFNVSTSGHSKGGGEAAYAAVMNYTEGKPIKAECFCSAKWGTATQKEVCRKLGTLDHAKKGTAKIRHYLIEGDVINTVQRWFSWLIHVGNNTTLQTNVSRKNAGAARHVHFFEHVLSYSRGRIS
ncbi:hypothetical protein SK355_10215 [Candidatus Fukatsuia symbiotica]|uniref:Fungal lipase-like domain-containing protein n=1 Tax=Candidatus Fukatsuia symbiotica TaxID=1878942 RepID=A0A2U8I3M6_9GAMM|nr:hypothetical protein [Candidatus Fukatsuia symbiotica]AWK13730.1 hypothetical protein CCS41_03350 [Candidatus Fukatsuia symbiotica]MEA9445569.1 hypothetical protein [Candidatus Fukatsuia symbiotica]